MQHIASVVNQQVTSHATQGHFTDSLKREANVMSVVSLFVVPVGHNKQRYP